MIKQNDRKGLIQRKFLGQCKHIKKDGTRCRAIANKETGLCSIHSGLVPRLEGEIDLSEGIISIRKFLSRTAMALKRGRIRPNDANALANICDKLLKCHQMTELEEKVAYLTKLYQARIGKGDYEDLELIEGEYQNEDNN